jgi:hypothetical protein
VALVNASSPELCKEYQAVYDKASFVKETAKNKREAAATKMFQLCRNLLSSNAKYLWNKIVREQMEADPFKDLHGVLRKGTRGLTWESFNDCIMFSFSLCFPTTQLSKRSTTFPTCSRSPRGLAYASSYSV